MAAISGVVDGDSWRLRNWVQHAGLHAFRKSMDQQAPLSKSLQLANSTTPLTLANGFNAPPNINQDTIAVDPQFQNRLCAGLEPLRAARSARIARDAGHLHGNQGNASVTGVRAEFVSGGRDGRLRAHLPSNFIYYTSNGNSTREAGTLNLRRRLHNGFTASLLYTYSKSIDDVASLGGGLGNPAQNWLNLEGERGPPSTDQRHVADITLQYTSGMGMGGGTLLSGWRGKLIKDWTFLDTHSPGHRAAADSICAWTIWAACQRIICVRVTRANRFMRRLREIF